MKTAYVYIMTNANNTVLYTDVTSALIRRKYEHENKVMDGFTSRYQINKLVYFEQHDSMNDANAREKTIKSGSRKKKIKLIESKNKEWKDLSEEF